MAKVTPHVYPLLQNVNFDLVDQMWHANCVFFELKKKKKKPRLYILNKK